MNFLLDTNVISELIAERPTERVLNWIDSREESSIFLSVITIGELRRGIELKPASRRRDVLEQWFETQVLTRFQGRIVHLDAPAMLVWGKLTAELSRAGRPLPAMDSLIAASCIANGLTLVTRNTSDFERTGVFLVNPWTD